MKKERYYIIISIIVIIFTILFSYLIFINGFSSEFIANVYNAINVDDGGKDNYKNYPIIDSVFNSSGENLVNTDVALTINVSSRYNIKNIKYSFDKKKWYDIEKNFKDKNVAVRLIFDETIDEELYIKVENDKGYESYSYKTYVRIDKEKPYIKVENNSNYYNIITKDNKGLSKIQFSNDKVNWEDKEISGEEIFIRQYNFDYKYVRVIDEVGNISEIKKIVKK